MADFTLTDEQKQYQQLARDFAAKEISPKAAGHDASGDFPMEICRKAWELGLMNVHISGEFGGLGLGVFDGCLIAEEIAAACTGIGAAMEANNLAQAPVIVAGNDEQKKEFLEPIATEFSFAAYCATGSAAGIPTVARRAGDEFIIDGQAMWIVNAGVARWYVLLSRTDASAGERGMSAFLVPRESDGIEVGGKEANMGQRAADVRAVSFHGVTVPKRYLLGQEGDGLRIALLALDRTRPLMASAAVGLSRSAMAHSIKYAKERTTFAVPIASHQAVSFMIADMAKDIEAARLLTWQAAWLGDRGMHSRTQAAIAKAFAADVAMKVATDAVQIFGGYGYSREYPVEKLMRDAKMLQIHEGTSQRERVALGKHLVGVN